MPKGMSSPAATARTSGEPDRSRVAFAFDSDDESSPGN